MGLQQEAGRQAAASEACTSVQKQLRQRIAQLREQAVEQQAVLAAAQEQLQDALQQRYAQQAAVQDLRASIKALSHQLLQHPQDAGAPAGSEGPNGGGDSRRQTPDQAVAALAAAAASGELEGGFFGRLHNVARVAQPALAPAVNAALLEVVNLVSRLLSTSRLHAWWNGQAGWPAS